MYGFFFFLSFVKIILYIQEAELRGKPICTGSLNVNAVSYGLIAPGKTRA